MITDRMTSEEIWAHYRLCRERYIPWLKHRSDDWKRIERKLPPKWYGGKIFEWMDRQKNLKVLSIHMRLMNSGYGLACATFLPVETHKGTCYYMLNTVTYTIFLYTAHLIKRYSERMEFPYSMPSLLAKIESRNPVKIVIYEEPNNNRMVFAMRDGIMLAEYDEKRHITIMRTFVSNAMLSETQSEAHRIISQLDGYFDDCFRKLSNNGSTASLHAIAPLMEKFRKEASAIYATYWED